MIKNPFCLPAGRLRPARKPTRRLSPAMSLLDRIRNAVFRLIMLSALSKASADAPRSSSAQPSDHYYYSSTDPHSVADCIEFIKKSATTTDDARGSTAGASCGVAIKE
ncbi:UNVERIFIED_CONTAM: hypothetical protein Slati_1530200 [Sesamum latifolium]|uniref:Uncharacterized protein n=1 Tax=Sesamum latifolium TaxID=2727402 RepID=A0AAW2X7G3_9LAMI